MSLLGPFTRRMPPGKAISISAKSMTGVPNIWHGLGKVRSMTFTGITPESFITMGNKTYYFDADYRMAVGQQIIDGALYLFDDYGALVREEDLSEANGLVYQDWKAYYYIDGRHAEEWMVSGGRRLVLLK